MDVPTSVGSRIKFLRERKRMNKAQLARAVGVSDVAVNYWERGHIKQIGHHRLTLLASTLGATMDELLGVVTNPQQDVSEDVQAQLNEVLNKVAERYSEQDPLYLSEEDLALLVENTPLKALIGSTVG
jgi:transcriptional regulator with XRE-family HTH domain